ncbi:SDR family oxidoreductase [Streptomyces sp. CMB-StM0423]|uniref:SDR family oxidoreductase n=1 Tax=Streptomyces sp. CMB-StM0423 TaxID=2059884 RepID=UPI000C70B078|nr:SDR family oxidoreductase [Streptomyces sp. CMB-StM0423]AUH41729.1 3-ketoacyl-ACP reductase [Streptomyces sp. CMB-StM0423]
MLLNGKTALVTGGSRGIGRAIVTRLARDGARVVFTYKENETAAAEVVREVPGTAAVRADQEQPDALADAFAPVRDGLDILVNNAAVNPRLPLAELTAAEFDRVLAANARFGALAMREAAALMPDGGRIVNISTLNTVVPAPGHALYCASKAVLEQFTQVAARELGPRGITVNTVSPGATETALLRATNPPEALTRTAAMTALQRLGHPEDIAAVVSFLTGPDAAWITGQNLRATGGLLI